MGHLRAKHFKTLFFRCFARLTIRTEKLKLWAEFNIGGCMKVLAKLFAVVTMISVVAGCASNDVYVPKIPAGAQALLLDYYDQPDNKVFIIAVDPSGDFAVGYDSGKATLKEATKVAFEDCEAAREALGVVGKAYIYAINDKVVYKNTIASAQKKVAAPAAEAPAE